MKYIYFIYSATKSHGLGHSKRIEYLIQHLSKLKIEFNISLYNITDKCHNDRNKNQFDEFKNLIISNEEGPANNITISQEVEYVFVDLPQINFPELGAIFSKFSGNKISFVQFLI